MTTALTQDELLEAVEDFANKKVAPAAKDWSLGEDPDPDLFREAADIGLIGLQLPLDDGGLALPFPIKCAAFSLIAGADFGFALSLVNSHNVALRLSISGSERIKQNVLPILLAGEKSACTALTEKSAGSDVAAMKTTAKKLDDGWVLTGEKTWIVNARHAGFAIVYAQTGAFGDADCIGAFLVELERDGVSQTSIDSAFSQTSIGTGGLAFDQVHLPEDALLLAPGTAFKAILGEINGARTYVAAMCNGMLAKAIDETLEYGVGRAIYGKTLADIPSWNEIIHKAQRALSASQGQTAEAIDAVNLGKDAQLSAAKSKIQAVAACQHHLPELLQAMGAEGLYPDYCLTRHLGAVQSAGFTDGATNLLLERVARLSA